MDTISQTQKTLLLCRMCSFLSKSTAGPCTVLGTVQDTAVGAVESVIKIEYLLQGVYRLMEKSGNEQLNVLIYNIVSGGDECCEGKNTACKGIGGDRGKLF